MRLELDLGALEAWPSGEARPGFIDALLAALPGLAEHACSYGEPGGFVRRLREDDGTWLGHVLEHVAIELQHLAGANVTFGKTRSVGDDAGRVPRRLRVRGAREAMPPASSRCACCDSLLPAESAPTERRCRRLGLRPTARDELIRFAQRRAARPVDGLAGARRRGARHPVAAPQRPVAGAVRPRQVPAAHPGHGHRPRRRTSRSRSPPTRRRPTRSSATLGLPVPQQQLVAAPRRRRAPRERLGFPVVDKPLNANHGRGVSIDLTTDDEVARRLRQGARAFALGHRRDLPRAATTTACSWSTASWSRRRGARPATWSATASTPSRSWSRS